MTIDINTYHFIVVLHNHMRNIIVVVFLCLHMIGSITFMEIVFSTLTQ